MSSSSQQPCRRTKTAQLYRSVSVNEPMSEEACFLTTFSDYEKNVDSITVMPRCFRRLPPSAVPWPLTLPSQLLVAEGTIYFSRRRSSSSCVCRLGERLLFSLQLFRYRCCAVSFCIFWSVIRLIPGRYHVGGGVIVKGNY